MILTEAKTANTSATPLFDNAQFVLELSKSLGRGLPAQPQSEAPETLDPAIWKSNVARSFGVVGIGKVSSNVDISNLKKGPTVSITLPQVLDFQGSANQIFQSYISVYKTIEAKGHHLFFERFNELQSKGKDKETVSLIYQYLDDLIEIEDFDSCSSIFARVNLAALSIQVSASFLFITAAYKSRIYGWLEFFQKVKAHITAIANAKKAAAVLDGLDK